MLDMMKSIFPHCRFIFQMRDHDQVARSSWWKNMEESLVKNILTQSDQMFGDYARTRDQCHTIQYEDYLAHPEETLKKLFYFLGEHVDMDEKLKILSTKLRH
jgi:hypothetical protein